MEQVNLAGGLPPARPRDVPLLTADRFAAETAGRMIFDTREPEGFAGGHIAGSHSIWLGGLPVFGGWMSDEKSTVFLLTERDDDAYTAAKHLNRIGIDGIAGALSGGFDTWRTSGEPIEQSGVITPRALANDADRFQVLDVREADEFDAAHIPGARHMYVGYLPDRLDELALDRDRPVVVTCGVGHRASVGVGILLQAGFTDVRNLLGGMSAWQKLELPLG